MGGQSVSDSCRQHAWRDDLRSFAGMQACRELQMLDRVPGIPILEAFIPAAAEGERELGRMWAEHR